MNDKAKKVKRNVLTGIHSAVGELFKESAEAEQLVYVDGTGKESRECPGAYSTFMTGCMARDMMSFSTLLLLQGEKDLADTVMSWMKKLKERDLTVRRMFDDRKDKRPVTPYLFENTAEIVSEISAVSHNKVFDNEALKGTKESMNAWAARFLKLDIWAYYLNAHETLDEVVIQAEMQGYDDDGNLVYGISDEDKESVKIIVAMAQILLQALIRIPAHSDQIQPTLGRFEIITALLKAIVEEDTEMLDRLDRAAKAAVDFSEENL